MWRLYVNFGLPKTTQFEFLLLIFIYDLSIESLYIFTKVVSSSAKVTSGHLYSCKN